VQGNAVEFVNAAVEAGYPRERTRSFENSEEAGKFMRTFVAPGDLLLLKGSRGVRMEKILDAIDEQHSRGGGRTTATAEKH
jgi:UDP-N-acetylmuramoyl-tripeptide--D-alanyl-D-alanine ligase